MARFHRVQLSLSAPSVAHQWKIYLRKGKIFTDSKKCDGDNLVSTKLGEGPVSEEKPPRAGF